MVSETITLSPTSFELATFGEVLYAFSSLRSTSGRRRAARNAGELLPWETMPGAVVECDVTPEPRRQMQQLEAQPVPEARVAKTRRATGRCHCGQCRNCQENARWERIFQEKFANSDYYHSDIRVRYASPLSSV